MGDKYLLFSGDDTVPNGGMNDYKGVFESIDDAKLFAENEGDAYGMFGQIVVVEDGELKVILLREYDYRAESLDKWIAPKAHYGRDENDG